MFIDTHSHIYSIEFERDFDEMIESARLKGVTDIYMPNIDSTTIIRMNEIAGQYSFCHPMIGLHPCHVKENYKKELSVMESHLAQEHYVGVGEIGIDLYWDKTFFKEQEEAFRWQINMAKVAGLPFVIHSRDSLEMTISIVEELQDGSLSGIFHCFNGSLAEARRIIDIGFYLGIGGVVTYKNAGVDKVVAEVPVEYLVLETDAPYLSPVPYRGKRNEPAHILEIAKKVSEIKGVSIEEIGVKTTFSAKKIFQQTPKT